MTTAVQEFTLQYAALTTIPVQDTERAASHLRTQLMDLPFAASPVRQQRPDRLPVTALGLVDVRRVAPHVRTMPAPTWSAPEERFWVRPEIAGRLEAVAHSLEPDYALGFWEGFRPLSVQSTLWHTGLELVAEMYPWLSTDQLEHTLETFIARPTAQAPHTLGRAVDVALLDSMGRVLDDPADLGMLAGLLSDAGLSSYDPEWWHWSYEAGDA